MASHRAHRGETLGARFWFRAATALARRPSLWPTAVAQVLQMVPNGWWRRPPFVPRPDPRYVRFRVETAYGASARPSAAELLAYLEWCRRWRVEGRRGGRVERARGR